MKSRRVEKRRARIGERRLFGPHTCRVGGCGLDGTVGVDLPGETLGSPPDYNGTETWTRVYYCEHHAQQFVGGGE